MVLIKGEILVALKVLKTSWGLYFVTLVQAIVGWHYTWGFGQLELLGLPGQNGYGLCLCFTLSFCIRVSLFYLGLSFLYYCFLLYTHFTVVLSLWECHFLLNLKDPLALGKAHAQVPQCKYLNSYICVCLKDEQVVLAPDRLFKIIFVGNSSVGKTSFLRRFSEDHFYSGTAATVGK